MSELMRPFPVRRPHSGRDSSNSELIWGGGRIAATAFFNSRQCGRGKSGWHEAGLQLAAVVPACPELVEGPKSHSFVVCRDTDPISLWIWLQWNIELLITSFARQKYIHRKSSILVTRSNNLKILFCFEHLT